MRHPVRPKTYPGTLADLATDIGDLRYDALARFLELLSDKILGDAENDANRGRMKLAASLRSCAEQLEKACCDIESAWDICKPFMYPVDIDSTADMEHYSNAIRWDGVAFYRLRDDSITLLFCSSPYLYTYTYDSAGQPHVENMKKLAAAGVGLTRYVRHYQPGFVSKIEIQQICRHSTILTTK